MSYARSSYRTGYRSRSGSVTPGRVLKANKRPGPCKECGEVIPAGAGHLWREDDGSWAVVHVPASQGGWLMHPEPVRGGCPASTDRRNAELFANGFFGPGATAPVSERVHLAATAEWYASQNPAPARPSSSGNGLRELSARLGSGYAVLSSGAVVRASGSRCEDAPCCGCCD